MLLLLSKLKFKKKKKSSSTRAKHCESLCHSENVSFVMNNRKEIYKTKQLILNIHLLCMMTFYIGLLL